MEIEEIKADELCRFCGKWLNPLKGRKHRLYCDEICKNGYHNELKRGIDSEIKRINKILATNFKIMHDAYEKAREDGTSATMKITDMYRLGFSFDYYTQAQGDYKFCYYYGYTPKNDKFMKIVVGFDSIVKKI